MELVFHFSGGETPGQSLIPPISCREPLNFKEKNFKTEFRANVHQFTQGQVGDNRTIDL